MKRLFLLLSVTLISFSGCKTSSVPSVAPPQLLDNLTFKLTSVSEDKTYGYTSKNPIQTGGGVAGERRYLNALTGPGGEAISYNRTGSCCPFKTPNGIFDNTGMLDRYEITYQGLTKPIILYINMYDTGEMKAPINFRFRQ